jgi:hypothetical protein
MIHDHAPIFWRPQPWAKASTRRRGSVTSIRGTTRRRTGEG